MGLKSKKELQVRLEHEGRVLYEVPESEVTSEITIGRSQESTWCIPATDRSASNNHAAIVKKHGKLYVVDKGSRNGIYFQGAKVPEHKLSAGDQIGIGDCRIYADLPNVSGAKGPGREFHLLEQLNGEKKGEMYNLDKPNMRLGSASDCDIILNDSVVSHFHASIEQKEGGCWIRDLGSRNGTQVNGTPLSSSANDSGRLLKDGDIVTISYIELKFWDKYAVHVRSHLLLKIVTVVLTSPFFSADISHGCGRCPPPRTTSTTPANAPADAISLRRASIWPERRTPVRRSATRQNAPSFSPRLPNGKPPSRIGRR